MDAIPQKDVMQLFGNWGYTVPEMKEKIIQSEHEAHKHDDKVGMIACSNAYLICAYAEHNDPKRAFMDMFEFVLPLGHGMSDILRKKGISAFIKSVAKSLVGVEISGDYSDEDYCNMVLESTYDKMVNYTSFQGAMQYQRQLIMMALGSNIVHSIMATADEISQSIFEAMVKYALANYEKECGMAVDFMVGKASIRAFDELTHRLVSYKDTILDMPSHLHPDFAKLTEAIINHVYQDMPQQFDRLNMSIGESDKTLPHQLYEFREAYFYVMTAFLLGMSAGIFNYNDYNYLMDASVLKNAYVDDNDVDQIINNRSN